MVIYPGPPMWAGTSTLKHIDSIYHFHCTQIPYKHSQPYLPRLPFYRYGLILRRTRGNSWKKHAEPQDKDLHFLYTRLILDLMRPLVNRWSPLTRTFHWMFPIRQQCVFITSHGENGSRPQRPLYPRNNDKVHFILHKILYYNTTVSDAMEICFVIIHHVLIDPEFI